jgi:hypothetical protein
MIRLFAAGAVVAAVMTVSSGARADLLNVSGLYDECRETRGSAGHAHCLGYVTGIFDAMANPNPNEVRGVNMCLQPGLWIYKLDVVDLAEALADIVLRFIEAHPEMRHWGPASVIARAFAETFPCK